MDTQEFYIRQASDNEARGLFGLIFFLHGHYGVMLAAVGGSMGLYLSTVFFAERRAQISHVTGLIGR